MTDTLTAAHSVCPLAPAPALLLVCKAKAFSYQGFLSAWFPSGKVRVLANRAAVWVAVETSTGQVELELVPTVEIPTAWSEKAQWPRCLKRWPSPERVECIKVWVTRQGSFCGGLTALPISLLTMKWLTAGVCGAGVRAAVPTCLLPPIRSPGAASPMSVPET